jgi:molybdate-binding protein
MSFLEIIYYIFAGILVLFLGAILAYNAFVVIVYIINFVVTLIVIVVREQGFIVQTNRIATENP